MSKHFGNENPDVGVDVYVCHTTELSTIQKFDWMKFDGGQYLYSVDGSIVTSVINAWYDLEDDVK